LIFRTLGLAILKMTLDANPAKHEQQTKANNGGRYEDEFAPKDRKSCGVRVSDHIFFGDVH
jgi:hypothetical protein